MAKLRVVETTITTRSGSIAGRPQKRRHLQPFSPREFFARIKAILRRTGIAYDNAPKALQFALLEIDEGAREARVDGVDVRLKPREFALLLTLASNPGVALSRQTLLERVWGFDFDGDERTVEVHVRRVRTIEQEPKLQPSLSPFTASATSSRS